MRRARVFIAALLLATADSNTGCISTSMPITSSQSGAHAPKPQRFTWSLDCLTVQGPVGWTLFEDEGYVKAKMVSYDKLCTLDLGFGLDSIAEYKSASEAIEAFLAANALPSGSIEILWSGTRTEAAGDAVKCRVHCEGFGRRHIIDCYFFGDRMLAVDASARIDDWQQCEEAIIKALAGVELDAGAPEPRFRTETETLPSESEVFRWPTGGLIEFEPY